MPEPELEIFKNKMHAFHTVGSRVWPANPWNIFAQGNMPLNVSSLLVQHTVP